MHELGNRDWIACGLDSRILVALTSDGTDSRGEWPLGAHNVEVYDHALPLSITTLIVQLTSSFFLL